MARVLTNTFTLAYAAESSIGTLPGSPTWNLTQPNSIGKFGAEITTVARRPISKDRQRAKGTPTDLASGVEFEADLTKDSFEDFIESFVFAEAAGANTVWRGANATTSTFVIPSTTASQGGKLQWVSGGHASLIKTVGYANAANNGLFVLTADTGTAATAITVASQGTVAETAPSNAWVELAGVRGKADDLDIAVSGSTFTITSAADLAPNTLGLTVGQWIFIGGEASANQFATGTAYGRITALTATTIVGDKLRGTITTSNGSGKSVDILFGRFIRNVSVDAAATDNQYLERSHTFEGAYPDLDGGTDSYLYPEGNFANEMTLNLPLADKATISYGFIGTDSGTFTTSRATNASSARTPVRTTAYNTASDIAYIQSDVLAAASTCFKSMTVKLANNVSPEKCLGVFGASFMNAGIFEVSIETQLLFTDPDIVDAIRNNTTTTFDLILVNDNGGIVIDIPAMTLGGGGQEFPQDQSLLVNITGTAFQHTTLGISLGVSLFPYLPTEANP